jgi:hypothetical protein
VVEEVRLSDSATFKALATRVAVLEGSPSFTGNVTVGGTLTAPFLTLKSLTGNDQHISLEGADNPYISARNLAGVSIGYLQWDAAGAAILDGNSAAKLAVNGMSVLVASTGAIDVVGVVRATGNITTGDTNFGLCFNFGTQPFLLFDVGDYIIFDRSANKYYFNVGGSPVASIDANGNLKVKGAVTQNTTP